MIPFEPALQPEARPLAHALAILLADQCPEDTTGGTAALIEVMAWWVRREAELNGARVESILAATISVLRIRALQP
jgi:hypothetical protein